MILRRMVQNSKRIFITGIKGQLGSTLDKYLSSYFNVLNNQEDLKNEELTILIGLLSIESKKEIDKEHPNYKLVAYYNNIQLKLSLMKKFENLA